MAVVTATEPHALDTYTEPTTDSKRKLLVSAIYYLSLFAVCTLGAWRAIGLTVFPLGQPLYYGGDALSTEAVFKNVLASGWYEYNPKLGTPWGLHFHDFPVADNLHMMAARILGLFTSNWAVAINVYYLMTFPLAALSAAWFLRVLGVSRTVTFGCAILYAFAPYHFTRNENHLFLAAYYPVPLAAGLLFMVLSGRPIWRRRAGRHVLNPLGWATARTSGTLLALAVVGTASSYYSVFTLILGSFIILALFMHRSWQNIGAMFSAMVALLTVMLANMAPDIIYAHGRPENLVGLARQAPQTEHFALKLAQLVLPVSWERIGNLGAARVSYNSKFPIPSEEPQLGFVAAAGFLFLLATALLASFRSKPGESVISALYWERQKQLGLLNMAGFLVATIGGLSTLFALLISDNIRAWNRMSIFLALFGLASIGLTLDQIFRWISTRNIRMNRRYLVTGVSFVFCAMLTIFGLYDQVRPLDGAAMGTLQAQWTSDSKYVAEIEAHTPKDAMVFQLPYMSFPESTPVVNMYDSDPLRMYLHSTSLRWSYGGIKGRPESDWAAYVSASPTNRMLVQLGAANFGGIHIDRGGYQPEADKTLEADLKTLLGVAPIISPDSRFAYYDMASFNNRLRTVYNPQELQEIGNHTVSHPVSYEAQGDFGGPGPGDNRTGWISNVKTPTIYIDNPQPKPMPAEIAFTVEGGEPQPVEIVWPDNVRQTVDARSTDVKLSRAVTLPVSRSSVTISATEGHPSVLRVGIRDWLLTDPVLTSFGVRLT